MQDRECPGIVRQWDNRRPADAGRIAHEEISSFLQSWGVSEVQPQSVRRKVATLIRKERKRAGK